MPPGHFYHCVTEIVSSVIQHDFLNLENTMDFHYGLIIIMKQSPDCSEQKTLCNTTIDQCCVDISESHTTPTYSSDPSTTRNSSTWSSIKFMLARKDHVPYSLDSQQRAGQEMADSDWARWNETA